MDTEMRLIYMLPIRDSLQIRRYIQTESEGMEKDIPCKCKSKESWRGFPGGTVVKNPPASAGNTGLSPGPGRSHMPQSN